MQQNEQQNRFPSTIWDTLLAAKDPTDPQHLSAMNRFISGYWRPVFYYLRVRGFAVQRAEDLTQDFFASFIERQWLRPADPSRGRFRSFLLTILSRFVADQSPTRSPRQNGFEQSLVPISALVSEEERSFEPSDGITPEQVFMRQWARSVIRNTRRRLKTWCEANGRPDWYRIFSAFNLREAADSPATQEIVAKQLRLSRDQVRYALSRTTEQFAEFLKAELTEHAGSTSEIEEELSDLKRLLADAK